MTEVRWRWAISHKETAQPQTTEPVEVVAVEVAGDAVTIDILRHVGPGITKYHCYTGYYDGVFSCDVEASTPQEAACLAAAQLDGENLDWTVVAGVPVEVKVVMQKTYAAAEPPAVSGLTEYKQGQPCTWEAGHWLAERGMAAWSEGFCPGCGEPLAEPDLCTSGVHGTPVRWKAEPDGGITFWMLWPSSQARGTSRDQ